MLQSKKGFTFIELLVVIATMVILFGVGYANFRDFQRRQYLESARRMMISDLRLAQEYALAGRGCGTQNVLNHYSFKIINPTSYRIEAVCGNNVVMSVKGVNMPSDIRISSPSSFDLWFYPLGKGTNIQGEQTVITLEFGQQQNGLLSTTITISRGGTIK